MQAVRPFKVALVEALKADAGVVALVGARVYDVPPRDRRDLASDIADGGAYLYLGPANAVRDAAGCGDLWRATVRIYSVSFALGRDEAWDVIAAAQAALEGAQLAMTTGGHTPRLWVTQGGDVVDPVLPAMAYLDVTTDVHN